MTDHPAPPQASGSIRSEVVVVTPFSQNCQLIWDAATGQGIVVDPGGEASRILDRVRANGIAVQAIVLTHGHLDHGGGAEALRRGLAAEGGGQVPVIGPHRADAFLCAGIAEQARRFGLGDMEDVAPDRWLVDGEELVLAGCRFTVRELPGHTPGHVVLIEPAHGFAVVGDTLFRGSVGRTDFPYGDPEALIAGIRRVLLPLPDDLVIVPGHGPSSTIGQERRTNPFLA